jgi:hypothetical protein
MRGEFVKLPPMIETGRAAQAAKKGKKNKTGA